MQSILRILFHAIPLITLAYDLKYLTVACVLTVGLWYVKTKKISAQLLDLEQKGLQNSGEYQDLLKLRKRWAYLTYIKP
ncbi:MAG: hypothetical protein ACOH5I_11100 [Oligoflexus sp.]